jgi:molybdopterin molybdotransferase
MKPPLRPVPAVEARRILDGAAPLEGREQVSLAQAAGRVLADPLVAEEDLPAFARSAVDGYALRAADIAAAREESPVWLTVVGAVEVGALPARPLGAGEAMAIPTGGSLPAGADAVVMVEHVVGGAAGVSLRSPLLAGRNVVGAGDDVRGGAVLLPAGRRLAPLDLMALAALGCAEPTVRPRPRVAVLSTGSELCPPGERPSPGHIRDANQSFLVARCAALGCTVLGAGLVGDDATAVLEARVRALASGHDVVIVSGGSSVGARDHTAEVFARLGQVLFHGIAVRPGRPTVVARAGATWLVGLPGVPTAAITIFEIFVRPLLRRLAGETGEERPTIARLAAPYASAAGREDYLRVRLVDRDGVLWAQALASGAASLSGVLAADALAVVPADAEALDTGAIVAVRLLR